MTKNSRYFVLYMLRRNNHLIYLIGLLAVVLSCAKRGNPTGGPKDEDPPVFVRAVPENYSTNFDNKTIRIYFDEFIKLKDLQKNLIISPPMNPAPLITPLGSPQEYIEIQINDTLIPNTTYVFNFGRSVVDNNEENPYSFFKYVMSTGDYIDSLSVSGQIEDALLLRPDEFVTVALYEVDSTYSDSVIYKEVPRYVTNTLDSSVSFTLSNLRAGTYRLAALKDEASNYTYEADKDKIAFYEDFINVPTTQQYRLRLFTEEGENRLGRPKFAAAQRINFPIQGDQDSIDLELLSEQPDDFKYIISKRKDQDTLQYWFKPNFEADSLIFKATYKDHDKIDTLITRKFALEADSLYLSPITSGTLKLKDSVKIRSSIPLVNIDEDKINIRREDSSLVEFTSQLYPKSSQLILNFDTEELQRYTINILPEAVTDYFGSVNDTLTFTTTTKDVDSYGEMQLSLNNAKEFPYIVQLVTEKGEVEEELYADGEKSTFLFELIEPGQYFVRLIVDENENKRYDTGNYLKLRQPERVIYYPKLIDIRSGWFPQETFKLQDPID